MRLAWIIVGVLWLGFAASGLASQQEPTAPPPSANQPAPQSEPPSSQKKEPEAQAPPQSAPEPSAPAEPTSEPAVQTPAAGTEAHATESSKEPEKKSEPRAAANTGANRRRHGGKRRVPASDGNTKKVVVRHGSVDEPTAQIVTGMPPEEANRLRQHAEQLLKSSEETLKGADQRGFDAQQAETVSQIHNYMEGARLALKEGDVSRGHTLALKAGLLTNDLLKRSPAAKQMNSAR